MNDGNTPSVEATEPESHPDATVWVDPDQDDEPGQEAAPRPGFEAFDDAKRVGNNRLKVKKELKRIRAKIALKSKRINRRKK